MHVVVAWEISAEGDRWDELNNELKRALKGYSWVRSLGSVYIVRIDSPDDRNELGKRLKAVAEANGQIRLIYSPAMTGGRYNGWLPHDLWEKIRQRTKD